VGTRVFNQKSGEFSTTLGPVFTNLLLADEINRAPAKVQSALLEVMQERQVTIAGETHKVPNPFLVMATQNPIETEGTYPLPEAQVDRFMMKVLVGYPTEDEEFVIVERVIGPDIDIGSVVTTEQLAQLQKECRAAYVDPSLITYAVKLVAATREPAKVGQSDLAKYVAFGASPRATIWLIEGARAGLPARPQLRAAGRCARPRRRRAAPPRHADLRSDGRRRDARCLHRAHRQGRAGAGQAVEGRQCLKRCRRHPKRCSRSWSGRC
jgi:MoxR-like ATPase